jgi:hypothetical protein
MGLSVSDYAAIRRLDVRYCHAVDFGDLDAVVGCFSPDGVYANPDPALSRRGEALRNSITVRDGKGHARHVMLGSLIDGDGNAARSLTHVLVTHDLGAPAGKREATRSIVIATGFHTDEIVKVGGSWLYSKRQYIGDSGEAVAARVGRALDFPHVDAGENRKELTSIDYEAIKQLLVRFGYTLDFGDYDGFADCFTPDGSYHELVNQDGRPDAHLVARGREELWEHALAVSDLNYRGRVRNSAISAVIDGHGTRARVSSYAISTQNYKTAPLPWLDPSATMRSTGIFRDEVVKVEGRWLFARRTFRKDTLPDVDALVGTPLDLELFHD